MYRLLLICLLVLPQLTQAGVPLVTHNMIRRLNPTLFNTDFSHYDQATAVFCGELSQCAYMAGGDYDLLQQRLDSAYGAGTFTLYNVESEETFTRALVCATDRFVVVAFRGTEANEANILTDLKVKLFVNSDTVDSVLRYIPGGHAGFRNGAANLIKNKHLFDTVAMAMKRRGVRVPVYLTGHSMGAAYSSLLIQTVAERFPFGGAYQFAPPLTIYCPDADEVRNRYGAKVYDIVNFKDQVPLGTAYLQRYMRHIGQFYRISDSGKVFKETEYYVGWKLKELGLDRLITMHSLDTYMEYIELPVNTNALIEERRRRGEFVFDPKGRTPINCQKYKGKKIRYDFALIPTK